MLKSWINRVERQVRYARKGAHLGDLAVGWRSRARLAVLGGTVLLTQRHRHKAFSPVVNLRLGDRTFAVRLATANELDVLEEVGVADEYGIADRVPAETIIDLGANVGIATLRLLAAHPGAHVIAVEADPALVPRLRQNVAGLPVTVVHAAVSSAAGERTFYRSDRASWSGSLTRTRPWQVPVTVPAITLADLLDSHGLDSVDLLKMDIEGAEWEAFEHGIPDRIATIVGEVHTLNGAPADEMLARISETMRVEKIRSNPHGTVFIGRRLD